MLTDYDFLCCLLDYIPDRIYFKDKEGRFVRVSKAEAEYLGAKDPAEVIGKTDFDFFAPELAQAAYDDEQEVMRSGKPIIGKMEKKLLLDGRTGWALVAKVPLRDSNWTLTGTCGISKDITALKETEDALQSANVGLEYQKVQLERSLDELNKAHEELKEAQARVIEFEKVQWIARLAFGVAHEVRNPLGILEMGISYLSNKPELTQDETLGAVLRGMSEAIQRADVVISALMEGAVHSGITIKSDDVPATVKVAVEMMKSSNLGPAGRSL